MDEIPNVNNLNGIPNFGEGLPVLDESDIEESEDVIDTPKRGRPKKIQDED